MSPKHREERRLGVFENRVLRKIFGTRKDEVGGYLEELHNFCTLHQILLE
jgi:transposase-like protein